MAEPMCSPICALAQTWANEPNETSDTSDRQNPAVSQLPPPHGELPARAHQPCVFSCGTWRKSRTRLTSSTTTARPSSPEDSQPSLPCVTLRTGLDVTKPDKAGDLHPLGY